MIRKVKPPLLPILKGKPQMLPRPTAEPMAAIRKPKLLAHELRLFSIIKPLSPKNINGL